MTSQDVELRQGTWFDLIERAPGVKGLHVRSPGRCLPSLGAQTDNAEADRAETNEGETLA